MSLSEKTDEELSSLLSEYGIKYGPIVDSTRKLYERKLEEAMKKNPKQPSSDKTYYREEEEEVTYITYHSPVKHEANSSVLKHRKHSEPEENQEEDLEVDQEEGQEEDQEEDQDTEEDAELPPALQTTKAVNHQAAPPSGSSKGASSMWTLLKLLLLLVVLAAILYFSLFRLAEPSRQQVEL
ncbi:unnamed protein product [Ophioblennius macclurei]